MESEACLWWPKRAADLHICPLGLDVLPSVAKEISRAGGRVERRSSVITASWQSMEYTASVLCGARISGSLGVESDLALFRDSLGLATRRG
jgi:hypothetical protein